jgi:peptide chain release factor 1
MLDKLNTIENRYHELTALLGNPAVQADQAQYRTHARALAEIEPLVLRYGEYKAVVQQAAETEALAGSTDPDMRELAQEELRSLEAKREAC